MGTKPTLNSDENGFSSEWKQTVRNASEPINITNLIRDGQEHIFKYLELSDLLSVADSSKELSIVINCFFEKKYVNVRVTFGQNKK